MDSLLDRPGHTNGGYNAGGHAPQYVQLEFPREYNITSICLRCSQLPNGDTSHQLYVGPNLTSLSLATNMTGYTINRQWLNTTYTPPLTNIRFISLNTSSSPSWVAWHKFLVFEA